jgi:hypothetical protein
MRHVEQPSSYKNSTGVIHHALGQGGEVYTNIDKHQYF